MGETFRLQKLRNISGKHLAAYVEHMQQKGYAASTIKTDLAAIRFWQDQIPDAKQEVSRLLGHEREDVTRIYLAGVEKSLSADKDIPDKPHGI